MDIELLVKVTQRAWSLPILALMDAGTPGRQAPLLAKTGAGRTAFAQSITHLTALGLLERNPGHGHPLRPEFRLTATGMAFAKAARRILDLAPEDASAGLIRRAWTVPVLAVTGAPMPFSQIKRALPPITDRALSQSLKHLQAQNWMQRRVDVESHPPRPFYLVSETGALISDVLAA